jgi:phage terminase large subunit-like protein
MNAQSLPTPRVERAEVYVDDVLSGRRTAAEFERRMVERHRADLDAASFDDPDFPWVFDRIEAERWCRFLEMMPHLKGDWAAKGETLHLEGWQAFITATLFGWRHRKTGKRRFSVAYIEVPRKNGKSLWLSGMANAALLIDREEGAEVVSAASTSKQARIVFEGMRKMLLRLKTDQRFAAFRRFLDDQKVRVQMHEIHVDRTSSVARIAASQTQSHDGGNPSFAAIDELHEHLSDDVLEAQKNGQGSRSQPMTVSITTAGARLESVCYRERAYGVRVLRRVQKDDGFFAAIYTIDEGDDPFDEAVWSKANPCLGVSKSLDYMRKRATTARADPVAMGNFLTKQLNVWSAAGVSALDLDRWRSRVDPALTLHRLRSCTGTVVGVDASKTDDFTSVAACGWIGDDLLVWDEHWATADVLDRPGNEQLAAWADAGWITRCEGALIDLEAVAERVAEISEAVLAEEIAYDPQYMAQAALGLSRRAWTGCAPVVVEVVQRPSALDPGLRTLQGLTRETRVVTRGSPVLDWMVSNARAKPAGDWLRLTKDGPMDKIDGVSAIVTALARMEVPEEAAPGESYLATMPLMVL